MTAFNIRQAAAGTFRNVLDTRSGVVLTLLSKAVLLATGGAGKVYLYTSNPDVATGDGVAMAYRRRRGGEHGVLPVPPDLLYHPQAKSFLITEALRGEGGMLRLPTAAAFMDGTTSGDSRRATSWPAPSTPS